MFNARKRIYKAYINFGIFSLYFMLQFVKIFEFCLIYGDCGKLRIPNISYKMLLNAAKGQGHIFYRF